MTWKDVVLLVLGVVLIRMNQMPLEVVVFLLASMFLYCSIMTAYDLRQFRKAQDEATTLQTGMHIPRS